MICLRNLIVGKGYSSFLGRHWLFYAMLTSVLNLLIIFADALF